MVAGIPGALPLAIVNSPYGHDGFLIEIEQLGPQIARFLSLLAP
jgi:homoserine O-acetyltransferase